MKIRIIGMSGSGKTTLAKKLAAEQNIPHFDLDDIVWDKENGYGTKNPPEVRDAMLDEILKQSDWVIEGVYYGWCGETFADADKIILLEPSLATCRFRVIRRYFRRKLGIEKGKKGNLRSMLTLVKWMGKYQTDDLPAIREKLTRYADKLTVCK